MVRKIPLYVFVLLLSYTAVAGKKMSDEEVVKELSWKWMDAVVKKDMPTLEEILAPDFILTGVGDTKVVNRATYLANSKKFDWHNMRFENMQVRIKGERAFVNTQLHFKVMPIPLMITGNMVDIWHYQNGKWQVESRYLGVDDLTTKINILQGIAIGIILTLLVSFILKKVRRKKAAL